MKRYRSYITPWRLVVYGSEQFMWGYMDLSYDTCQFFFKDAVFALFISFSVHTMSVERPWKSEEGIDPLLLESASDVDADN